MIPATLATRERGQETKQIVRGATESFCPSALFYFTISLVFASFSLCKETRMEVLEMSVSNMLTCTLIMTTTPI